MGKESQNTTLARNNLQAHCNQLENAFTESNLSRARLENEINEEGAAESEYQSTADHGRVNSWRQREEEITSIRPPFSMTLSCGFVSRFSHLHRELHAESWNFFFLF